MKKITLALGLLFGSALGCFSQGFYDINTINTIEITFAQSNWDYLLDQLVAAGEEERLLGSVTINGQLFDSVGVRYKGNSSYNASQVKNPFNIKLDYIIDNQEIENFGTLKLSNVYKDPSFVREVLSYEIARKYIPAGLSNYANVYVNGTYIGLYTSDQDVDKYFMRTHFSSDENARIKGELANSAPPGQMGGVWEYYGADSSLYFSKYALESDYGWNELVSFLDTLNNYNTYVDQVLNIDRHLWFLAFENTLVNLDSPINNPQNYYIYKDDAGRMNPIPWDLNESFGVFTNLQSSGPLSTTQLQHLNPFVNLTSSSYPVISKILSNATYRRMYVAHLKTILSENFSNGLYLTRALELQGIISASVQADPNKFYTFANFTGNVYNAVGSGPNSVIGIVQLMNERASYLSSLTEFQYQGPVISAVSHSPGEATANSEVWITATVSNSTSVKLAYRSTVGAIFNKIAMYDDGNHQDGLPGDGVFGVGIMAGTTDIQYYIYAENLNAASFSPARAEYEFYSIVVTLETGNVVINEFMADNESTITDPAGEYEDWVELYNNGSVAVNLNGYYLSDKTSNPGKWSFPDVTIEAGGYLIVWADEDEDQEGIHSNFKLSASGEALVLSDNSLNLLDQIEFGPQKADTTTGRYPNGTGDFVEMFPTFGAENSLTGSTEKLLNLSVYLEGLYSGSGTMNSANDESGPKFAAGIADLITVELHNQTDYNIIEYSASDVNLGTNGQALLTIPSGLSGSYYITIKHRNSIETTSVNPISFASSSMNYTFDHPAKAYGNNLLLMFDGYYAIYGGDVNQDGYIDTGDMTPVDNDGSAFQTGYLPTDCNGDGFVDTGDMTIIDNNGATFVGTIIPLE